MDKALKQRLLGAAVVTALVVIVVPELVREPTQAVPAREVPEVQPNPADTTPQTVSTDGQVVERYVLSLPGQEALQEPTEPQAQPATTLPAVPVPILSQPSTLALPETGEPTPAGQAMAGMVTTIEDPLPNTPATVAVDSPVPEPIPTPMAAADTTTPPTAEPSPPPVNDERQLAARDASHKLGQIYNNRRLVQSRAQRLEDQRREERALAAQRERATREAQARQQAAERERVAEEARRQVAATANNNPPLPQVRLIAQPEPQESGVSNWTVQAGSFSRADYAQQLRDRLVAQRFPATVRPTQVNGQTRFRVHVGLQASRGASEQVLQQVRQQLGINGAVMPLGS